MPVDHSVQKLSLRSCHSDLPKEFRPAISLLPFFSTVINPTRYLRTTRRRRMLPGHGPRTKPRLHFREALVCPSTCSGRSKRTSASFGTCETLCSVASLKRLVPGTTRLVGVGAGVEPATSRSIIWCSAIELTNVDVPWSEPIHGTGSAKPRHRCKAVIR